MKRLIRLGVWPLMKHTRAFDYRVDRIRLKSAFGPTERLIPEEYGIRTVEEPPPSWFWGVGGWTYVSRHKSLRRALAALAAHGPARILSAERPMTEKDAQPIPTT